MIIISISSTIVLQYKLIHTIIDARQALIMIISLILYYYGIQNLLHIISLISLSSEPISSINHSLLYPYFHLYLSLLSTWNIDINYLSCIPSIISLLNRFMILSDKKYHKHTLLCVALHFQVIHFISMN